MVVLMATALDDLRADFKKHINSQNGATSPGMNGDLKSGDSTNVPVKDHILGFNDKKDNDNDQNGIISDDDHENERNHSNDNEDNESVWSEEDLIKGVYAEGPDGELIQMA